MAVATVYWYDSAIMSGLTGTPTGKINLATGGDALKVTLHKGSPPSRRTTQFVSQLTNELTTGGGYTSGGVTLTGQSIANDGAGNITFTASTVTWTSTTFPSGSAPTYAVISDRASQFTTAATQPLIAYVDFGAEQTTSGGDFVIAWTGGGITKLNFP